MDADAPRAFYFGCWGDQAGHHYREPGGRMSAQAWDVVPFGTTVDGWLPRSKRYGVPLDMEQPQGVVHRMVRNGWTAIGWWDRSVDSRGNSHSTFVFEGVLTTDDALARARDLFPEVFDRLTYDVVPAEPAVA